MNDEIDDSFHLDSVEVLGPLLAVFAVLAIVRAARRRPGWTGKPALTRVAAVGYAVGALHFTLFPIYVAIGTKNRRPWGNQVQTVLFEGLQEMDPTFFLNIVLFIPFGFLLPLISRRDLPVLGVILRALAASVAIELTQLVMYLALGAGGTTDVDDLIANTLGGAIGALFLHGMLRIPHVSTAVSSFALPRLGAKGASPERIRGLEESGTH
ncbi:VanZ family protein [Streptomyces sp. NPDC056519]|uniref:VanZ family protein n=1 Tax=Streptomyces sp. NPDC056519 TaxID=3345849 RepID=UPI0036C9858F